MKKIFVFLSVAVFMLVLATSCNGSKDGDKVTLTVEPELGQLSKYLSVTDKDVTVTLSEKTKKKDDSKEETYKIIAASFFYHPFRYVLGGGVIVYFLADTIASILAAKDNKRCTLPLFILFICIHISYGIGTLKGLLFFLIKYNKK